MSYAKFLDSEGTFDEIRDRWISEKRYSELTAFIHENWDSGQWDKFFDPFEKHLIEQGLLKEYKKFWKGLLRHRLNDLWYLVKEFKKEKIEMGELNNKSKFQFIKNLFNKNTETPIERRTLIKQKETLKGLNQFIVGLELFNDQEEILKTRALIYQVERLEKPKSKVTSDSRKIDEELFWQLIDSTHSISEDKFDFIDKMSIRLQEFKPAEIRRFEKIFLTKIEELNDWKIWALAYIVRRGCGDDEFDYFKAWVISKGSSAFDDIKNLKIDNLNEHFFEDPQLEEFYYLSEGVYENKTGELMPPVRVKKHKISGKEWNEDTISNEFPELINLFGF